MVAMETLDKKNAKQVFAGNVPHPIPYQGSKRQLAPIILSYMPSCVGRLVEPFAGSAAVTLATAFHKISSKFWINDAHRPIISLWKEIIDTPEQIANRYEEMWYSQEGRESDFFNEVRLQFNKNSDTACFLFLLARCVKGAIRYNLSGEFNNSPDHRRKGATPQNMRTRIFGASYLLQNRVEITALDYRAILKKCCPNDIIYMDPPYQGVCGNKDQRYAPKVDHGEFVDELSILVKRQRKFLVSYDGRTGDKEFGDSLPASLGLTKLEIHAGRSSQATLLGRNENTYESLYLSPALVENTAGTLQKMYAYAKTNKQKAFVFE